MLSYGKMLELAAKALDDYVTDNAQEANEKNMYLVKDAGAVFDAYMDDLGKLEDIYDNSYSEDIDRAIKSAYDEDMEGFFARHGIAWE